MNDDYQQSQTKNFFDKFANEWHKRANDNSAYYVNVIKQRNQFVENISSKFLKNDSKTLDVGCGTGELVLNLLKRGFDAYGLDFASTMIEKAKSEASKQGTSPDRFLLSSFFDFIPQNKFELISANGFIEYISEDEFEKFIYNVNKFLIKNGILVMGSRNRLFNVFSFNNYTKAEIETGTIIDLIEECIIFNTSNNLEEILGRKFTSGISKNLQRHDHTGIGVDTRYQYTPFQIIKKLKEHGFEIIDLEPIHIHILTTGAKNKETKIHDFISNQIQDYKDIHLQAIPQSSSFMIAARKI
jgi:2-polyprenyl-3-methyl-5-hydroxy-6-metoxy-1,4-benzoquinol methylase